MRQALMQTMGFLSNLCSVTTKNTGFPVVFYKLTITNTYNQQVFGE